MEPLTCGCPATSRAPRGASGAHDACRSDAPHPMSDRGIRALLDGYAFVVHGRHRQRLWRASTGDPTRRGLTFVQPSPLGRAACTPMPPTLTATVQPSSALRAIVGALDERAKPHQERLIQELRARGVDDVAVLDAFAAVPRHLFVDRF